MFMVDYMQMVKVKNITNETLEDLILSHNGVGGHDISIKKLKPHEEKEVSMYTLRANEECDLILTYSYKGKIDTIIVYDKLSVEDKRLINLQIADFNGTIKVDYSREISLYD